MKNCIRCKKEKKKKRALFGANDLKLHISKYNFKKKKKKKSKNSLSNSYHF